MGLIKLHVCQLFNEVRNLETTGPPLRAAPLPALYVSPVSVLCIARVCD